MDKLTNIFNELKTKIETAKEERATRKEIVGLLKGIDEKYYSKIFELINDTIVIGDKDKYNTLEYLEHEVMTADARDVKGMGLPVKVDERERAHLIKGIIIKFIEMSKDIRRDQWKNASDVNKKGDFEAKKHTAQESAIDRNLRLIKLLRIDEETARKYGIALSVDELGTDEKELNKTKKLLAIAKQDPAFNTFYDDFKKIYKLGEPTSESKDVLNKVYADLTTMGENNSFGLKGDSLKAAIRLVEETIKTRRNNFVVGKKDNSPKAIEEQQADLGMNK